MHNKNPPTIKDIQKALESFRIEISTRINTKPYRIIYSASITRDKEQDKSALQPLRIQYSAHPPVDINIEAEAVRQLSWLAKLLYKITATPSTLKLEMAPLKLRLTKRELQILKLSASGFTAREIAETLKITTYTVNTHIESCIEKLECRNKAHATARATMLELI
ncbi:response regulator transcription factor [Pseudomonas aeruginosa]|uniref:response regulator transcription factor n=2 Tax=Pseudomonas aeruginosa TaxID=287 RepID=UPI0009A92AD9|nr:response regulator transcription factor [Pseudomonas aeruginosa]ELL1264085.1 response regulator transcription factor [Pseudomonas aeruginosa]ELT3994617.1 response regulator transcription factor [Pseudomonas aeruginosa]MBG4840024.1 response regulator transcription factor [Pseudomonas aeruginosa]MBH3718359.1 response regulator transcription factor [Pseudomonas aeruginosa]